MSSAVGADEQPAHTLSEVYKLETHLEEGWMLQIKEQDEEVGTQQQLPQVLRHLLHLR